MGVSVKCQYALRALWKADAVKTGGFMLLKAPAAIVVSDVVKFIDGPINSVKCAGKTPIRKCVFAGSCVFNSLWEEAREALEAVYENKTLQNLLDDDNGRIYDYVICECYLKNGIIA